MIMTKVYANTNSERRQELSKRLEAIADRICDLQECLMDGIDNLKPIEYDRLLDEYRAELIRYDRLDQEMIGLEEPKKSAKYKEQTRVRNHQQREKINY